MTSPRNADNPPPFSHRLHRVYRSGEYRCGNYRLRPGQLNGPFDEWIAGRGHSSYAFVTAYNPYSAQNASRAGNLARSQVLSECVKRKEIPYAPAAGVDPTGEWPEEIGLLLFDIPLQEALQLGSQHDQHAILYGTVGSAPEVLWCHGRLP